MALNPDAMRDSWIQRHHMLKCRCFDANGLLKSWDLGWCDIAKLPESFGDILCTGGLNLGGNLLESLPLGFSTLSVGHSVLGLQQAALAPCRQTSSKSEWEKI